jgi:hypothetical protein
LGASFTSESKKCRFGSLGTGFFASMLGHVCATLLGF